MKYTVIDFNNEFYKIKETVPSYRLGQFFITKFIKDSSSDEMQKLWNEDNTSLVNSKICEIIQINCWDLYDLPVLKEEY